MRHPGSASSLALIACGFLAATVPAKPVAAATSELADIHADASGIAWFKGDTEAAFASAKRSNKPVLLYWGAQWCPPCKQLKSAVFNRPDFIEKSKLFVAVYLDGDLPDAQKWGDVFRVTGYPTVVVLKPDKTEITRIAGNMDLNLYASVLDDALADVRPVKDLLAYAVKGEGPLSAVDCRRLAYHAFGLEDEGVFERPQLEAAFGNASRACPVDMTKERARFAVLAAAEAATRQKAAIEKGSKADKTLGAWIVRVNELLANKELSLANADVVRGLPKEFYLAARQTLPQVAPTLRERAMAVGDAATVNPQFAPADQLAAQLIKIRVAKAYAPDGKVPTDVRSIALNTATKMLDARQEPYVRAGVVNSASNIYIALEEREKLRALMVHEAATSNTPWYYLGDLADVEEEMGDKQAALRHMAEAYQKAKGPASRFQWGFNYLSGLLRLTPDDTVTIEKVGAAVLKELDGPNRVHRRTLSRLTRLDKALREWNNGPARAAVDTKLRAALQVVCQKSPGNDCAAFVRT